MSGFVVRRATFADVPLLRELRMEAITLHPSAFSRDPVSEAALTDEQWRLRVEKNWWFVCEIEGNAAGIASFFRDLSPKTAHVGSFGAMYVRKAYRGQGAGDALIEAAVEEAAKHVELLDLAVNAENPKAIALYERHGFRAFGRKPRALKVDGVYYDEIEMMRAVSLSD